MMPMMSTTSDDRKKLLDRAEIRIITLPLIPVMNNEILFHNSHY